MNRTTLVLPVRSLTDPNTIDQYSHSARELLSAFLSGRTANTLTAYRVDLEAFHDYLGVKEPGIAVAHLLGQSAGNANRLVLDYRNHMAERGLQPATINRRLASIRSLIKLARTLGIVAWSIEIQNLKTKAYRDTRGPGRASIESTLAMLRERGTPKAIRDAAIICLFATLALRISEVTALNYEDFDLVGKRIAVLGKGRTEKEWLTLPDSTIAALEEWFIVRGREPGPLFTSFDRARKGSGRITRSGLYKVVRRLGSDIGVTMRPHGMRHTSITEAVKLAQEHSIGLREVMQFSRHQNLSTLQIYVDRERDVQGQLAGLVAAKLRIRGAR